jgi:hypothetical protein
MHLDPVEHDPAVQTQQVEDLLATGLLEVVQAS